eukprot:CAMPEP_0194161084 /NCGR_PEP_ID=MMETSP0152-20130528/78741_1 /TAXON_ID=1049557 /ORGANISM="Thalassiothrix antarctica, Strain L6-D1" /LENGTH=1067 /DNA_ID=CAMNT_0038870835 /DNA_START=245 /DNA_END=3448 /DNA_ORIENTATION=-
MFNRSGAPGQKRKVSNKPLHEEGSIDDLAAGISTSLKISSTGTKQQRTESRTLDHLLDSDDDDNGIFMEEEDDENTSAAPSWNPGTIYTKSSIMSSSKASKVVSTALSQSSSSIVENSINQDQTTRDDLEQAAVAAAGLCAAVPVVAQKPLVQYRMTKENNKEGKYCSNSSVSSVEEVNDNDEVDAYICKDGGHVSDSGSDYTDDDYEGEAGYKAGGYHPVKVGEVYNQRYVVIKKLGWGHFSTVWMVKDRKVIATAASLQTKEQNQFFALKVQKSAEHYTEAALDEVELLNCVASVLKKSEASMNAATVDSDGVTGTQIVEHSKHVAILHDSFFHTGANGRHMCMVFTMLGCNLLGVIKSFNYRGIPVPVVKRMIRGICMGLDFLHRKCNIIHTDLKPENVLLQFPNQMSEIEQRSIALSTEKASASQHNDPLAITIIELESALKDPNLLPEERRRIKNRIRKKKQRMGSKTGEDGMTEELDASEDEVPKAGLPSMNILSDLEMEGILSGKTSRGGGGDESCGLSVHGRVLRRLPHSSFVVCNFGEQYRADAKLSHIMQSNVQISRPDHVELNSYLENQKDSGGVAKLTFILRAYSPEEELANNVSIAFDNLSWNQSDMKNITREWRCKISISKESQHETISTMFRLAQRSRKDMDQVDREIFVDITQLISANIGGDDNDPDLPELPIGISPRPSARSPSFSTFIAEFPIKSTFVVLSFLESRIPGVVFMTYKREDGNPQLDNVLFGKKGKLICDHSSAMKIKDDGFDPSSANPVASCLIGFDLRLVKGFSARPPATEDGDYSFKLSGQNMEKVASWWNARNPIQQRVRSFMGVEFSNEFTLVPGYDMKKGTIKSNGIDPGYTEGGKVISADALAAVSSTKANLERASHQPDLKDVGMLQRCRAVVVDLGNACWTHRHFSEDIQTRQYRAPEVLIGSKYDTSADMWSLACVTFELLTGDLLFDPRAGEEYDRDEDHLAMFQELLGKMPKRLSLNGKFSKKFFDRKGNLKHIKQLKFWPIQEVLCEKYHFAKDDAQEIANFIRPLLEFDPASRATALDALRSDWLLD